MSEKGAYLIKYKETCRCCLDNTGSKSMWVEYFIEGEREVYGEMLMECFGVSWDAEKAELICESCITRLREAVKLKIEFLAVQELLQENVVLGEGEGEELSTIDPKIEAVDAEMLEEEYEVYDSLKDFEEFGDEALDVEVKVENIDPEDSEALFHEENETRDSPKKKKGKRKKMYKQYIKEDMEKAIEAVRVHGKSMLEAATRFAVPRKTLALRLLTANDEKNEVKDLAEEKRFKLIEEIRTILKYTNAIPFKSHASKCFCAYCFTDGPMFDDPDRLRDHTKSKHAKNIIRYVEVFMRPSCINEVIKMDVTNLECTACNIPIGDWNSMFLHFAEIHDLEFDEAYNKVIPYSILSDYKCVLCYGEFSSFSQLDKHMNAHYCNYICYECGDPFLSSARLDAHLRMHKTGKYPCDQCEKLFSLHQHRIRHVNLVHNRNSDMKNTKKKSPYGQSYNGISNEKKDHTIMTCEFCGKCFSSSVAFYTHIKKVHKSKKPKSKKNYICGVCGVEFEKFVTLKHHWREHMELIPFHKMDTVQLI